MVPPRQSFGGPLRQRLVSDHLLGRAHAAWRFLVVGVQPPGTVAGGTLGSTIGVGSTSVMAGFGIPLACLSALRSPARTVRTLPPLRRLAEAHAPGPAAGCRSGSRTRFSDTNADGAAALGALRTCRPPKRPGG